MAKPNDRERSEAARQRGAAVLSDPERSRWHGSADDPPGSSGDDDPGSSSGGPDLDEVRPASGEDAVLTGYSGDSVRTRGVQSATTSSLGSEGAGAPPRGRKPGADGGD